MRQNLFYKYKRDHEYVPERELISIYPHNHNVMQVRAYLETDDEYENRMIIGTPNMIALLKFDPFGKDVKLPKFVPHMRLTNQQINTFPIKLSDSNFCGNPYDCNDLSHYQNMKKILDYFPDFYFYFIGYEFKLYGSQNQIERKNELNRVLYLYPREGKTTEAAYVMYGIIKFFPEVNALFQNKNIKFDFIHSYRDRFALRNPGSENPRVFIIPRVYYPYHIKYQMHLKGDYVNDGKTNPRYNNKMYICMNLIARVRESERDQKQKDKDRKNQYNQNNRHLQSRNNNNTNSNQSNSNRNNFFNRGSHGGNSNIDNNNNNNMRMTMSTAFNRGMNEHNHNNANMQRMQMGNRNTIANINGRTTSSGDGNNMNRNNNSFFSNNPNPNVGQLNDNVTTNGNRIRNEHTTWRGNRAPENFFTNVGH